MEEDKGDDVENTTTTTTGSSNNNEKKKASPKKKRSQKKKKKDGKESNLTPEEKAERDRVRAERRAAKKKKSKKSKRQREREKLLALQEATASVTEDTFRSRAKELIAFEKAKIRLSIKKAKAALKKSIPLQVNVQGSSRKVLRPYDRYFVNQLEPVLNELCWSCYKGKLDRVKELVEIEQYDVNNVDDDPWEYKQSPLHWAAKSGNTKVISYLIEKGAVVRAIDASGSYPLHVACRSGHLDASILLVRSSDMMDLFVRDYDADMTPLEWATISTNQIHQELIKELDRMWIKNFTSDLLNDRISDVVEGKNLMRLVIPKRRKKPVQYDKNTTQNLSTVTPLEFPEPPDDDVYALTTIPDLIVEDEQSVEINPEAVNTTNIPETEEKEEIEG